MHWVMWPEHHGNHMFIRCKKTLLVYILRLACWRSFITTGTSASAGQWSSTLSKVSLLHMVSNCRALGSKIVYKDAHNLQLLINLLTFSNLLLDIYNLFSLTHNEVDTPFRILAFCGCGICRPCSFRSSTVPWSCSVWWSLHYTEHCCPRWCKSFVVYHRRLKYWLLRTEYNGQSRLHLLLQL